MDWPYIKLRDAARRIGGGTPSRQNPLFWDGDLPWFTVADLEDVDDIQHLKTARECISRGALSRSAVKLIPKGAVIFSNRVVVGKVGIAQNDLTTNQDFSSFIPNEGIDPEFLAYFLIKEKKELRTHQRGATIKGVTTKVLDELDVPALMLTKQRRIVAFIKECMERIAEIRRLNADIEREHQSLIEALIESEMSSLEGETTCLKDICAIRSKLVDPRDDRYQNLLHIGGANIESKTGQLTNLNTAVAEKLKSGKFLFDEKSVLYNKIRPYLVKIARPDFHGLCSADMYPLVPNTEKISRDFLFYLLRSRDFTSYAVSGSNRAGMPKVNRKHLFSYKFQLPDTITQARVADKLDSAMVAVRNIKNEMKSSNNDLSCLRGSVLRRAFSEELLVQ